MDSMVIIHFNYQLKVCVNFVFLLCKQRIVRIKIIQDQNSIMDKINNNSNEFERVKMYTSLKHVWETQNPL